MLTLVLNNTLKILLIIILSFGSGLGYKAVTHPEVVGYWLAQSDIAYDSIWAEYISDCDCTQPLE